MDGERKSPASAQKPLPRCGEGLFGGLNCEGAAVLFLAFCGEICYIIERESAWAEGRTGAERWAAPVFDDDFAFARKLRGRAMAGAEKQNGKISGIAMRETKEQQG